MRGRLTKRMVLAVAVATVAVSSMYARYEEDDIYYDAKKSSASQTKSNKKAKTQTNYISDFSAMDVDDYNRRDFYYSTPIDTIGYAAENGEDFVYTQQIQKYYNPTIVVDNANVLNDILSNSYGNVEVVINNGYPSFASVWNAYSYAFPYYNWGNYWGSYWSVNVGPFWFSGPGWSWGSSWHWAPAWAINPYYTYYPSWGWTPGWGYYPPRPPYNHHYAQHRPGGTRPVAPRPGWSTNTRPGVNTSHARPGNNRGGSTPSAGTSVSGGYHRGYTNVGNSVNVGGSRNNASSSAAVAGGSHRGQSTQASTSSVKRGDVQSVTTKSTNRVASGVNTPTKNNATGRASSTVRSSSVNQSSKGTGTGRSSYKRSELGSSEFDYTGRYGGSSTYRSSGTGSSSSSSSRSSSRSSYNSGSSRSSYSSGSSHSSYSSGGTGRSSSGSSSSRGSSGGGGHRR